MPFPWLLHLLGLLSNRHVSLISIFEHDTFDINLNDVLHTNSVTLTGDRLTFHTICLIVSTSKSRTVSNSFFANIKQLFRLKYGSFCICSHRDVMIFTYWLELTKLRTDERNVGEAFLYLSFKIVLSKKSEEIYFNHVSIVIVAPGRKQMTVMRTRARSLSVVTQGRVCCPLIVVTMFSIVGNKKNTSGEEEWWWSRESLIKSYLWLHE